MGQGTGRGPGPWRAPAGLRLLKFSTNQSLHRAPEQFPSAGAGAGLCWAEKSSTNIPDYSWVIRIMCRDAIGMDRALLAGSTDWSGDGSQQNTVSKAAQTALQQPKHMTDSGSSHCCQHNCAPHLPRSQMLLLEKISSRVWHQDPVITIQMGGDGVIECEFSI